MAPAPHDPLGLRDRLAHFEVGVRFHEKGIENPGRIHEVLRGRQCRHHDKAVEREAQDAALVLDDADDAVGHAADPDALAERRAVGEQPLRHGLAQHGDRRTRPVLFAGKGPADRDFQILDVEVALACGRELDVPRFFVREGDGHLIARLPGGHHGDRESLADRFGIAEADPRTSPPGAPHRIGDVRREHRLAPQLEGVHAVERLGEFLRHVPVHAVGDAPGSDQRRDADEHAQQREAALQLLGADGLQRHPDGFEKRH